MDSIGHALRDTQAMLLNVMAKNTLIRRDHYLRAMPASMHKEDKSFLYSRPIASQLFDGACKSTADSLKADEERDVNRLLLKSQINTKRNFPPRFGATRRRGPSGYNGLFRKGTNPEGFRQRRQSNRRQQYNFYRKDNKQPKKSGK